jgi:hypothetical protein
MLENEVGLGIKVFALEELLMESLPKLHHDKERTIQDNGVVLCKCDIRKCLKCRIEFAVGRIEHGLG